MSKFEKFKWDIFNDFQTWHHAGSNFEFSRQNQQLELLHKIHFCLSVRAFFYQPGSKTVHISSFLRLHSITLWTQNWGLFSYFQCSSQAYQSRWLKAPNFAFPWDLSLQMNVTSQGTFNPFSRTIRHSPRREQSRKNEIWKFSPPSPF